MEIMLLNPDQQQQQLQPQQEQLQLMGPQATSELDPAYAQFRDQSRFWIQRVAVPLLMVIGIFGNSITVIIMTRRRMRSTTNMYLAALAFVDMLYLVLTFLLGLSHYPNMAARKYYAYWKLRPFLMMLTDACSNTSVWLTVTFTIERYIAVKYPMKGKVWCTEARAKMLIVCVFVFGILFASPVPFEWKVIEKRVAIKLSNETSIAFKNEHNLLYTNLNNASTPSSIDHTNNLGVASSTAIILHKDDEGNMDVSDSGGGNGAGSDGVGSDSGGGSRILDINNSSNSFGGGGIDGESAILLLGNDTKMIEKTEEEGINDSFILTLDYSDFGKNETYKTIYYWSTAVIFYFIPLFSLMLFNGFLIKSVHQSKRERTKMTRHSTTSSTQSSTPKADINVRINGSGSDQALIRSHKEGGERGNRFKLLRSSSRHKRNCNSKDSSTIEEISQSSPLLDYSGSVTKKNHLLAVNATTTTAIQLPPDAVPDVDKQTNSIKVTSANSASNIPLIDETTVLTVETKASSELNVQISCDNEFVISERAPENGANEMSNQQQNQGQPNNSTDPKETIKTIALPQARYSPLRRSQITNSSSRSQQSMVPASTQERRITIMLIAVVILFLVCQIPSAAMLLYTSVHELVPNTNEHALVLAFGNIFNFLMAVNAAGNFILYSFLSKKYRRTFMILFCSCLGSKQKKFTGPKRLLSVRFVPSEGQLQRNSASIYQNNKTSDKVHRDTLV